MIALTEVFFFFSCFQVCSADREWDKVLTKVSWRLGNATLQPYSRGKSRGGHDLPSCILSEQEKIVTVELTRKKYRKIKTQNKNRT